MAQVRRNQRGMIFQARDEAMLRWINGFGFVNALQVQRFMQVNRPAAYARLKKLEDAGYIRHQYILHGQAGIYRVTKLGAQRAGDDLLPLQTLRMGSFNHDLLIIDLAHRLEAWSGGRFVPERRIRHDEGLSGVGQTGHIADGFLYLEGKDDPIAIELELTLKGRERLRKIIEAYSLDFSVDQIWYFTDSDSVQRSVEQLSKGYPFIKVKRLSADASAWEDRDETGS